MSSPSTRPDPELLERLLPRLAARARRLTGDPAQAEDLAQEAAFRLWSKLKTGAQIDNPEAYAMTTLRRAAFRQRQVEALADPLPDNVLTAPAELPARLALSDLRRAIATLPPDQAELMELVLQGVTSPAEAARRLNIPEGTVMSRLARARARLRAELGLGPSDGVSELC